MKKGIAFSTLALILIAVVSFMAVSYTVSRAVSKAPAALQEEICRGAVALRQKIGGTSPLGTGAAVPIEIACKTTTGIAVPADDAADRTKEGIKHQIADRMARCWYMYGEGLVPDVFGGSALVPDKCAVCSTIDVKEGDDFKRGDMITAAEMLAYLYSEPYTVVQQTDRCKNFGGACVEEKRTGKEAVWYAYEINNEVCTGQEKKYCEYSSFTCLQKGGSCTDALAPGQQAYPQWKCPAGLQCAISQEDYISYLSYVQRYAGDGVAMVLADITPGESYAISYASPSTRCGETCYGWNAATSTLAAGVGGMAIGAALLPFGGAGVPVIIVSAKVAGIGLLASIGNAVIMEGVTQTIDLIRERKVSTVYFTTLSDATQENTCRVIGNE